MRTVDVAEGAVAHLLEQRPALQTRIVGHLALGFPLLCHDAFQHGGVDIPVLGAGSSSGLLLVLVTCGARSCVSSLGSNVAIVNGGDRVTGVGLDVGLLLVHDRLADAYMLRLWVMISLLRLMLGVDVGNVCRGLAVGGIGAGLFAMAQEVLKILDGSHLSCVCGKERGERRGGWAGRMAG